MEITDFFGWENGPALIGRIDEFAKPFFLPPTEDSWVAASGEQMVDFFEDGTKLSKEDFEDEFGIIGVDLPDLPET